MHSKLITLLFSIVMFGQALADTQGMVKKVIDGDTIILEEENGQTFKIRLLGIDAPELDQPYGFESSARLASYIVGKTVYVVSSKKDRYQRLLGKIMIEQKDINYQLVKFGYAWHFKRYSRDQDRSDAQQYADAEIEARQSKLGIWQTLTPIPPWEWRKKTVRK